MSWRDISTWRTLLIYVIAIAIFFLSILNVIPLPFMLKGFDNVLESLINFSAIIIGFYTAMYGVLLTLKNSDIFKKLKLRDAENIVKFQLYESLISSFLILILSILLQILINYKTMFTTLISSLWLAIIFVFAISTFQSISLLLKIMFNHDSKNQPVSLLNKNENDQ